MFFTCRNVFSRRQPLSPDLKVVESNDGHGDEGKRGRRGETEKRRWAANLDDTKAKAHYYPDVAKQDLFKEGYIAARSSHSRGSTVDLTIIELSSGVELDMGSTFDFFGPISWPDSTLVPPSILAHRLLLRTLMMKYGFNPYAQEWWHFTLAAEPYPETFTR